MVTSYDEFPRSKSSRSLGIGNLEVCLIRIFEFQEFPRSPCLPNWRIRQISRVQNPKFRRLPYRMVREDEQMQVPHQVSLTGYFITGGQENKKCVQIFHEQN
ncbi:hypothetical protein AVEN_159646-1 [Araneus ventricosus]|uniref:Uncharacterized protein n=1 Tax=Araneus ventricosus TaxID=182803 RepID=A0A4Y2RQZ9_ARAVE|nr:hypothetical protein AVEN_159646-1 [Araneus ventricosus]